MKNNKLFRSNKRKPRLCMMAILMFAITTFTITAFAADPVQVVTNLQGIIFSMIRAIGMIILAFGIVQVGMSLKSHDPSQRANGFMTLAGGVIIMFAEDILNLII